MPRILFRTTDINFVQSIVASFSTMNASECIDFPRWLLQLTNQRLGQLVTQTYAEDACGGLRLHMGNAYWVGAPADTVEKARNNVALAAYQELTFMTEKAMLQRLGMTPCERAQEFDDCRKALSSLKQRMEKALSKMTLIAVQDRWNYMIRCLDTFEIQLRCYGFPSK